MRILYIATSFPKPEMGSTIYTDLAEALKAAGHHVTVTVTEQKRNQRHTTVTRERGLDVVRIMTGNYYDVGLIRKGITSLCIPFRMRRGIRKYVPSDKYDLVLYEAPPVTNARLVKWAKRRFRCPSYLMLKDIFPQNAVDIGIMKKGSLLHRYFRMKEKQLYESASIIGCMSEANRKYILESEPGLNADKVELFPNTICLRDSAKSDVLSIRMSSGRSSTMRARRKVYTDTVTDMAMVWTATRTAGRPANRTMYPPHRKSLMKPQRHQRRPASGNRRARERS